MEYLVDKLWSWGAIGDGTVGVYAAAVGDVAVGKTREAAVSHNADPPVRAPELPDYAHWDMDAVVDGVVLADRIHAVDGQTVIAVEAYPANYGRLERVALFTRQALVVAGYVHIETPVQQVVDVRLLGCEL